MTAAVCGSMPAGRAAHARETGRERDLRDRQHGGLQQNPRGAGTLRAGQRDGPGAELGGELPLHLAGAVAEACGEAADALTVDDTVLDQPHGAAHDVRTHVPLRGTGNGVRTAPPAGPESGALRGGGRRVEPHVVPLGVTAGQLGRQ
jgi:hypothetical protein